MDATMVSFIFLSGRQHMMNMNDSFDRPRLELIKFYGK